MPEQDIFCPNCQHFIGLNDQCDVCHWLRPVAAVESVGQLRWEARLFDEDNVLGSSVFITQLTSARGLLFVPTESGDVIGLDVETGLKKWTRTLHRDRKLRVQAGLPWRNLLLMGTQNLADLPSYDRSFMALNTDTGEDAWLWPTNADNLSVPVIQQDTAFFTSSEPALYAFDLANRELRWSSPSVTWSPEPPAIAGEVIVVPSRGPHVAAYQVSDGNPLWTFTADDTENELLHLSPAMSEDTVYFSGWGKTLYAVDLATGNLRWRFLAKRGITCPPVVSGEKVLVAVKDVRSANDDAVKASYGLYALDRKSGNVIWKFQTDRHIYTLPCVAEKVVMFGADDKRFHALDLDTGSELWNFTGDDKLRASPFLLGDRVFTGQRDHKIYCLQWKKDDLTTSNPDELLAQDKPLEAAAALALSGRCADAAQIYAANGEPYHAAVLYQEAGQLSNAVELFIQLKEFDQVLSLYRKDGNLAGEANILSLMGSYGEAAALYEEIGDLDHAVQAYVKSGRTGYAAMMMWKKGRRKEASELYQMINQDDQAAEIMVEDHNFVKAAEIYMRINKPDVAAGVLVQGGLLEQAAAINEQIGQLRLAAEQYTQAGKIDQGIRLYTELQDWSHVVELAEKNGDSMGAADALVRLGQLERAAQLFQQAGQPDLAMAQYEALGKWEKVVAMADEQHLWQRKASALSNLGMMTQAGETYEQAARELNARSPDDDESIAALFEAAAKCYTEDGDWLRQSACMNKVCQLRKWPYLKTRCDLPPNFFQGEYSLITLVVQNVGYSPAHNIQLTGVGQKFRVDEAGSQVSVRLLGVDKDRSLRLMLLPRPDVLGQVMLRVELVYEDPTGGEHNATFEQGVQVLSRNEKVNAIDMAPRTPISDTKVNEYIVNLTRGLEEYFNDEEMQDLCYVYLQVEYENLRGDTKSGRARELVLLMRRHGRLAELKSVLQQLRPNATW